MFINNTKDYNQHFLIDKDVILKYIDYMNLSKCDDVIEIGPGNCEISNLIAPKVGNLMVIEIDDRLSVFIEDLLKNNNVQVQYGNVLDTYIPKCNKIVSSLPYNITEPFIEKLLRCEFDECILIVGQRFAKSVSELIPTKLSLLTNCFFAFEYLDDVKRECFEPIPRVDSAIVRLKKIKPSDLTDNRLKIFREIFYQRKMKIKNSLIEAFIITNNMTKKSAKEYVISLNISDELLESNIENLSNEKINELYSKVL